LKYWTVVDSVPVRIFIPAFVIPLIVFLLYVLVPGLRESPWTGVRIAGAMLAVIAYALVIASRVQLGKSFSVRPQATELVAHGLYSRIANPMYVFLDIMLLGLILASTWNWLFAILPVLMVFQVWQAGREAKVLQQKFGQAYLDYRKQIWF
jgi:protein-S-isoprenylcysteine O-methyltransferase Ste14